LRPSSRELVKLILVEYTVVTDLLDCHGDRFSTGDRIIGPMEKVQHEVLILPQISCLITQARKNGRHGKAYGGFIVERLIDLAGSRPIKIPLITYF